VDLGQALDDLGGVGLVGDGDALVEAGHLHDAGEDVRQREEDQGAAVRDERRLQALLDGHDDVTEATVNDLAALGVAGRTGGVDDRTGRVVVGRHRGLLDLLVRDAGAGLGEVSDQVLLDDEDVALPVGLGGEDVALEEPESVRIQLHWCGEEVS